MRRLLAPRPGPLRRDLLAAAQPGLADRQGPLQYRQRRRRCGEARPERHRDQPPSKAVSQGQGATLRGDYRFAIAPGPSRTLSAVYRPAQRRFGAEATLRTRVRPTLRARRQVVRTGTYARLSGEIPGPRNDGVVIVLQVRQGNGWLAFRRYRTRGGGRFQAAYLFRRTARPTTYEMRAQVRESAGYPYLQGDSDPLFLRVLPKRHKRRACPAGKRRVKRRGKARCVRSQAGARRRCAKARRAARRRPHAKGARRRAGKLCAPKQRGRRAKRRNRARRAGVDQPRRRR